ncbi:hypothetical protein QL285_091772 [Trifolium repens]|nr:hypothetical protein QL285_091772 [Trifolium repens]
MSSHLRTTVTLFPRSVSAFLCSSLFVFIGWFSRLCCCCVGWRISISWVFVLLLVEALEFAVGAVVFCSGGGRYLVFLVFQISKHNFT